MGHSRFALLGYSAGSPFALAASAQLPHRVTTLGIVSGIGPADRPDLAAGQAEEAARLFRWARTQPRLLRAMLHAMRFGARFPSLLVKSAAKGAPAADRAVLARPGAAELFAAFVTAAFEQGIDGVATDFRLASGPWPFTLSIGAEDGHASMLAENGRDILAELAKSF